MGISGTSGQLYKCMPHHAVQTYLIYTHYTQTPTYNNNLYARAAQWNCFFFLLLLFRVFIYIYVSVSLTPPYGGLGGAEITVIRDD